MPSDRALHSLASELLALPQVAAIGSGGAGGLAMAAYEVLAVGLAGGELSSPILLIAASVDGMRLPFELDGALRLGLGVVLHMITSGFWGYKLGHATRIVPMLTRTIPAAVATGMAWGITVWLLMGIIVGPALDPALRDVHPQHYFVAHLVYGITTALTHRAWMRRSTAAHAAVTPPCSGRSSC